MAEAIHLPNAAIRQPIVICALVDFDLAVFGVDVERLTSRR